MLLINSIWFTLIKEDKHLRVANASKTNSTREFGLCKASSFEHNNWGSLS